MKGAIVGDIVGSVWEFNSTKDVNIDLFYEDSVITDDTILTIATADVLMNKGDYAKTYAKYAQKYPDVSWGGHFREWFKLQDDERAPYNSYGNGSAMRVAPIGWWFDTLDETLAEAKRSAEVTHNHPEGIKGAQATAAAIYMARKSLSRQGGVKDKIKKYIEETFEYDLSRKFLDIQKIYNFDVTCQGSVPESIICFLESNSFEECVRMAVALGGDADTQACIAGSIAEAFYGGVPVEIWEKAKEYLDEELLLKVVDNFIKVII